MLLPAPISVASYVIILIQEMNYGEVKKAILKDAILLKLASKLYMRHKTTTLKNPLFLL